MNRRRPHPREALTEVFVRFVRVPGLYADGRGLYLKVDGTGAKRWILRTMIQGKRRDMGLGSLSVIPLAKARQKAELYRKIAREGGDPIAVRRG